MTKITIRELHLDTGRWVRRAAARQRIVITDRGSPVAELAPYNPSDSGKPLPNREKRIRRRSRITVDSSLYVSEGRERRGARPRLLRAGTSRVLRSDPSSSPRWELKERGTPVGKTTGVIEPRGPCKEPGRPSFIEPAHGRTPSETRSARPDRCRRRSLCAGSSPRRRSGGDGR